MLWKRKKEVGPSALGLRNLEWMPPCPAKKEFQVMMELLLDAERYDTEIDSDCTKTFLSLLKTKIEAYLTKQPIE